MAFSRAKNKGRIHRDDGKKETDLNEYNNKYHKDERQTMIKVHHLIRFKTYKNNESCR